jgi:hypothetical protein
MRIYWVFSLCALMVLGACKPKPEPPPPTPAEPKAPPSGTVSLLPSSESSAPPPPSAEGAPVPAETTRTEPPPEENNVNETLTSVIRDFYDSSGRLPKDIQELVTLKLIPKMPEAPPGKKYELDPVKKRAILVNK